MRVAQIAPLYESVPPRLYGGTERVVSHLTEALVEQGHEVTLYASGDSVTRAHLRPGCERALRLGGRMEDAVIDHLYLFEQAAREAAQFDIIHSHVDFIGFPFLRRMPKPHLSTLHGRLDLPNLGKLFSEYREQPLVSISQQQREPQPAARWLATVYHGLPEGLHELHGSPGRYLAFMGRLSPEKRVDVAIEIARLCGMPLKIAAKIDQRDKEYVERQVKPLLKDPRVEFLGEIAEHEKGEFLGNALALLFPVDWPEPFGLVMIEALACGTPVIARACGSVPEVIQHGVTGYLFRSIEEAVRAVGAVSGINRHQCRREFERRFAVTRMAADYVQVYERLVEATPQPSIRVLERARAA